MSYNVEAIPNFKREAKQLIKKFRSLKQELASLEAALQANPQMGTPLGSSCFKIRISIGSKGKGKRGGGRVITYVYVEKTTIYLLTIFDKGEQQDIADDELKKLIKAAQS